ncbi:MAG TPA: DUF4349 domain-containing protein [Chitinophagaceae bacterium]|nr:DUF4349 domain-containing protein [Chitinophagaceae bacterium]
MNFIRLTAIIAVTMITFACDSKKNSLTSLERTTNADQKEIGLVDFKSEAEKKNDNEGFYKDTIGKQVRGDKEKQQPQHQPAIKPDWDKKIIKTASLNLEVKDYNTFYSSLREKVRAAGGYIAQEEQSQSVYKIENFLSIKVPVDQFDNAVVQLTGNTEKINEKKISSQDVTSEVIDTKSRMEAKKQVRLRYMDLLKQAKNMEEILSVQSEINGIQEEIESAAGRIEYLGHSSTFSTINLTYYQILNSSAKDTDGPSFGTKLSSAFRTGWSWIGDLFVGLVSIWPLFLLIFITVIVYKKTKLQKPKQA